MGLGPLPDAAQTVGINLRGSKSDTPWTNKLYLRYVGAAPSVANLSAIGVALANSWNTNFAPMCGTDVTLTEVDLVDLSTRTSSVAEVTGLSHAGTRAGTTTPNSVACVVSWKINNRYRGGHPRMYVPAGVIEDTLLGTHWDDAFQAAMVAAADAFLAAANGLTTGGDTWSMVAMHFYRTNPVTHAVEYIDPPLFDEITTAAVDHRIDTQRRRLGRPVP